MANKMVDIYIDEDGWLCNIGEMFRQDFKTQNKMSISSDKYVELCFAD